VTTPDVVVVGGGPVGLAAAIAARQRGFDVLVADRAYAPIDKPCGEGVMPDGVATLGRLGVSYDNGRALPFRGIRFTEEGRWVEGRFHMGSGLGIRRTVLHQALVDRATQAGVAMRWGERVSVTSGDRVEIDGRKIPCRWVVGADGRASSIRRRLGFQLPAAARRRIGMRQHFRIAPWTDFVEVHWHNLGQAVVTPIANDEICVSLLVNEPGRIPNLIALHPELQRRLVNATPSSPPRGSTSGSSVMRSVVRNRVALIGDAAGTVDALTGEGLSIGFRHALALADSLAKDNLQLYERAHRRISRIPELMARTMLLAGARRVVRRRVLRAMGGRPRVFSFMLGIHTGTLPLGTARFDWMNVFLRLPASPGPIEEER
jgi:flavin-dependent dehydrogenase